MKRIRSKEAMSLFIAIYFILIGATSVFSEGIRAPYIGGQEMRCDQGNADDPSNTQWNPNPTHTSTSTMAYAWDFNWDTGDNDAGMPVVSPANGEVVVAGTQSGWGKTVIVQFESGNTYRYGRVAHLDRIYVVPGQKVSQGQVVGLLGRTGYNQDGAHLHYQTQNTASGASVFSEFEDIGRPLEDQLYTSGNSNVIDLRESTPPTTAS